MCSRLCQRPYSIKTEENGENLKVNVTHLHARARAHTHTENTALLVGALVSCITYDFMFPVYVHTLHNK